MHENALNDVKILGIICLICSGFFGILSIMAIVLMVFDGVFLFGSSSLVFFIVSRLLINAANNYNEMFFEMNKGLKCGEQNN